MHCTSTITLLKRAVIGAAFLFGCTNVASAQADADAVLLSQLIAEGDAIYHSVGCSNCHGNEGQGNAGPTFVGNEALARSSAVVAQILTGNDYMPGFGDVLSDREVSAVATFIRNSWGNSFGIASEATVQALRQ